MSQSSVIGRNRTKDELTSDRVAGHVNEGKKVWILEINVSKGRLVQQGHPHIVSGPYYQPDAARGQKGAKGARGANVLELITYSTCSFRLSLTYMALSLIAVDDMVMLLVR